MKTNYKKTILVLSLALIGFSNYSIAQGVNCVAVSNTNLWAGTNAGLYLITNNGDTWTKMDKGYQFGNVSEIALSGSKLIIGNRLSTDNAQSWNEIKKPDYSALVCFAINETGIFGATNPFAEGFVFSTDNGNDWKKRNKGLKKASVKKIMIAGTKIYVLSEYSGSFVSFDNAEHWEKIEDTKYDPILNSKAVAANESTIFVGNEAGLRISTDNGFTWTALTAKEAKNVRSLSIIGTNIYAVFDNYIYLSTNNGVDWKIIKNKEEEERLAKEKAEKDAKIARQKVKSDSLMAIQKIKTDAEAAIKAAQDQTKKAILNHFQAIAELSYNKFDAAILKFSEAINAKPDFVEALKARADCYHKMNLNYKEKEDSVTLSKISTSVDINVTNKEAILFTEEYKKTEMLVNDTYNDAHYSCYYKDDNGWFLRGTRETYSGYKVDHFNKAIAINNAKPEYYVARGNALNSEKRMDEALTDFTKAVQLNPKYEWYEYETRHVYRCSTCDGKGYTLLFRVQAQEVNGKTNSNSSTEKKPCSCDNGIVIKTPKVKSVKLPG